MKQLCICGSSGSIGQSTCLIAKHLKEEVKVISLVASGNQLEILCEQVIAFRPKLVAIFDETKKEEFQKMLPFFVKVVGGAAGVFEAIAHQDVNMVVMAIVGLQALPFTLHAIEQKKDLALASKEVLVAAGKLVMAKAKANNVKILPVDSEHNAIFQAIGEHPKKELSRIVLTASGGPFYRRSSEELEHIRIEDALLHPNWKMGPKVTIDSSTLMNKGLEVIEASALFDLPLEKIDVVIHPQSIIHGLVEFIDGCILAQMSQPKMTYPIQYALTYPKRLEGMHEPFDFTKAFQLDFLPPDKKKFPALQLAYDALKEGNDRPCVLNAANEVLVFRFLQKEISWKAISEKLQKVLEKHKSSHFTNFEEVYEADRLARKIAMEV